SACCWLTGCNELRVFFVPRLGSVNIPKRSRQEQNKYLLQAGFAHIFRRTKPRCQEKSSGLQLAFWHKD
ncbi:MAG: hypothetical protein WA635_12875, partial [Gallionella sp.]